MKRFVVALLMLTLVLGLSGCGEPDDDAASEDASADSSLLSQPQESDTQIYLRDYVRWNMSLEELDDVGLFGREVDGGNGIVYYSHEPSHGDMYKEDANLEKVIKDYVYVFNNNQLKAYFYRFNLDNPDLYSYYVEILEKLTKTYGAHDSENYLWTDETYKPDSTRWNDAFRYDDFTIKTVWYLDNFDIVMTWDHAKGCSVAFCEKGYMDNL